MENLQVLKWTDQNGNKKTLNLNDALGKLLYQASKPGMAGTERMNAYGKYEGLPIDLGKDRRGDYPFSQDIDYSLFDNPSAAKAALEEYFKVSQEIVNKSSQLQQQIIQQYGKWNNINGQNEYTRIMQKFANSPEFLNAKAGMESYINDVEKKTNENPEFYKKQELQNNKIIYDASAPYGKNPKTGAPLTESQAYSIAREKNINMTMGDFRANPGQYLRAAGIEIGAQDPSYYQGNLNRPNEGIISEQNKTEMSYTEWSQQQRSQGLPSSYQDWLKAGPSTSTTTPQATTTPATQTTDTTQSALQILENSPFFKNLPEDQKAILRMTVKSWDPAKEVNMENVLNEFEKIKTNTIDPQFKEQVDVFTSDVASQYINLQRNRDMELEAERTQEGQNIRQARSDLEARGMTFSGQGIEALGDKSAYAQEGQTGIPNQMAVGANEDLTQKGGMTFKDGRFFEGTVNQANRLMSSSSALRYQDNLRRVGRAAEDALGASGAAALVPGYTPAGVSTGSIEANKQQQYGTTLSQLSDQNRQVNQYNQPLKI